jgi:16S rRNA (cytosine967-C5)-methyltransferase
MTESATTAPPGAEVTSVSPARLAAFKILQRVEEGGAFASVLLAARADELQSNDRSLCHELVMGVLRRQLWLDHLIAHYANRTAARLDLSVLLALRLGLYQLRFLSRIPASAAVNESVKLTRLARLRSAEPLVNAILRRATREPDYDPVALITDSVERLAVETSHPIWLIERWAKAFGVDKAAAFARANNETPPVAFRIVNNRANEAELLAALLNAGASLSPSPVALGAWRITGAGELLREFAREGHIYIQDEASQLVAHVVEARAGDRVLDVCAAPGSKTTHIADLTGDQALIVAGDLHPARLKTLMDTAEAQGFGGIHGLALDGSCGLPFPEASFDRVLVDAPCTGTGTLRRNPEIRWRISTGDIDELSARQSRILQNAAQIVKVGGRLVYSTCSVEPEENEQIVDAFLGQTDDFEPVSLPASGVLGTTSGAARTWPQQEGADGFFIAAFKRRP